MDTYDANVLRVNASNDLGTIEKHLLTVAKAAYDGRDGQALHEAQYEIHEAIFTLQKEIGKLGKALEARWRAAGNETRAIYDEIKATLPGFLYEWNRDLPQYNPLDRQDLYYLITSTIADIWLHDYDRPEAEAELTALRIWAQRLEKLEIPK